jgi:hypothetical protein
MTQIETEISRKGAKDAEALRTKALQTEALQTKALQTKGERKGRI